MKKTFKAGGPVMPFASQPPQFPFTRTIKGKRYNLLSADPSRQATARTVQGVRRGPMKLGRYSIRVLKEKVGGTTWYLIYTRRA